MIKISLVVPFFNEEQILKDKIVQIHNFLNKNIKDFEIIFVDDGSTDDSKKIVSKYTKPFNNLSIISYKKNQGRGGAIRAGFAKARGSFVGYIDCDLEIKIKYIIPALKLLEKYDIVVASKFAKGARVDTPILRKVSSIIYNNIVRLILNTGVSDHQAGFKIFRRNASREVVKYTTEKGWLWDIEALYLAKKKNYTIKDLPIEIRYGYRKLRSTFVLDFLKMPFFVFALKRKVDSALYYGKK